MKFRITIKGNSFEAEGAARKRGLVFSDVREVSCGQTTGTVESSHLTLGYWLAEPAKCVEGIGFPSGTLLFYNEK